MDRLFFDPALLNVCLPIVLKACTGESLLQLYFLMACVQLKCITFGVYGRKRKQGLALTSDNVRFIVRAIQANLIAQLPHLSFMDVYHHAVVPPTVCMTMYAYIQDSYNTCDKGYGFHIHLQNFCKGDQYYYSLRAECFSIVNIQQWYLLQGAPSVYCHDQRDLICIYESKQLAICNVDICTPTNIYGIQHLVMYKASWHQLNLSFAIPDGVLSFIGCLQARFMRFRVYSAYMPKVVIFNHLNQSCSDADVFQAITCFFYSPILIYRNIPDAFILPRVYDAKLTILVENCPKHSVPVDDAMPLHSKALISLPLQYTTDGDAFVTPSRARCVYRVNYGYKIGRLTSSERYLHTL